MLVVLIQPDFWALTLYDPQTRSQLQTNQALPTLGSQSKGIKQNDDGSYDIYFGPEAPEGFENNWLETISGKSWFVALRMYGPLEPWIQKQWRPGDVELLDQAQLMEGQHLCILTLHAVYLKLLN